MKWCNFSWINCYVSCILTLDDRATYVQLQQWLCIKWKDAKFVIAIVWWSVNCRLIVCLRLIFLGAVIGKWLILIKKTWHPHLIQSLYIKKESKRHTIQCLPWSLCKVCVKLSAVNFTTVKIKSSVTAYLFKHIFSSNY